MRNAFTLVDHDFLNFFLSRPASFVDVCQTRQGEASKASAERMEGERESYVARDRNPWDDENPLLPSSSAEEEEMSNIASGECQHSTLSFGSGQNGRKEEEDAFH